MQQQVSNGKVMFGVLALLWDGRPPTQAAGVYLLRVQLGCLLIVSTGYFADDAQRSTVQHSTAQRSTAQHMCALHKRQSRATFCPDNKGETEVFQPGKGSRAMIKTKAASLQMFQKRAAPLPPRG